MIAHVVSFLSGLLFAVGLALSGMTSPAKVVGFLDVSGAWDPSLGLTMMGALPVLFVARFLARRLGSPAGAGEARVLRFGTRAGGSILPLFAPAFAEPPVAPVEFATVAGAALFGVGWGVSGFCPGPAIASIGAGATAALVFVPAMAAGMLLSRVVDGVFRRQPRDETGCSPAMPSAPPPG